MLMLLMLLMLLMFDPFGGCFDMWAGALGPVLSLVKSLEWERS